MTGILAGKRTYVTGGSSGIGAEIVRTFAAQGARVAIGASSHAAQARETAKALPAAGEPHIVVQADFYDKAQTEQAADAVLDGLGGLDIFVDVSFEISVSTILVHPIFPGILDARDPLILFKIDTLFRKSGLVHDARGRAHVILDVVGLAQGGVHRAQAAE